LLYQRKADLSAFPKINYVAASAPQNMACALPTPAPLVSLIVLTCNRHGFLRLSLASVARQTYPRSRMEFIVVDDGSRAAPQALLQQEARSEGLTVRFVRLLTRASIGEKRNAGLRAARGQVILHWDDDDLHAPEHVASLVCPIARNMSEMTALTFSWVAKLSSSAATFYAWGHGRGGKGHAAGPFLGSLAFRRSVATASTAPFPDVSLSEDLFFVEKALSSCHRMLQVPGIPLVYTRHHSSASNTWQVNLTGRMTRRSESRPPAFVTSSLRAAYVAAERDAAKRDACKPLRRHPPPGIEHPLRYPYLPMRCCRRGKEADGRMRDHWRKPCLGAQTECSETFCGSTKGTCTASCTCAGERAHGRAGTLACGEMCCKYWRRFWKEHPDACGKMAARPLKSVYCSSPNQRDAARLESRV
jgi:hypothetical protein